MWRKVGDIAARCPWLAHAQTDEGERDARIVGAMHRVRYGVCVMPTRTIVVQVT
jgi:hypothetical protein